MASYQADVQTKVLEDTMMYDDTEVLTYRIEYPKIGGERFRRQSNLISAEYARMAERFQRGVQHKLYAQAVAWYKEAQEKGYPFFPYEAQVTYLLTYNENCTLSLYFDQYTFTGGAHGSTTRFSDTWDLASAQRRTLPSFFWRGVNVETFILLQVNRQIQQQIESGEGFYFDDYEKNTKDTFQPNQFYLQPDGMVIYFQQYDIAPYSSGIPSFLLPYSRNGVQEPRCRRG